MSNDNNHQLDGFRKPLLILGILLVGLGGIVLLYLGIVVFNAINNPEQVHIVEFIISQVKVDEVLASARFADKNYTFSLSESARLIIFLFLGVFILSILAGILKVLISGGLSIIKIVTADNQDHKQTNGGNNRHV